MMKKNYDDEDENTTTNTDASTEDITTNSL